MKNNATSSAAKMVATKSAACSTPERRRDSPSRDSDSLYDSDSESPVPFLCTQDGEADTDVVWNFYTPKSETKLRNSTPLSRKSRRPVKNRVIDTPLPRRRTVRPVQKRTELFQDLIELNQNVHELIAKNTKKNTLSEKQQSGSEDDIFNDSGDSGSPKSGLRTNSRCLRRNVLSSKFSKPDPETALESDDSINECLIKASQIVEEKFLLEPIPAKRSRFEDIKNCRNIKSDLLMNNDSMDAILNNIKLDSPSLNRVKKCDSPCMNNDSFDSLVGQLDESTLERLTQMPVTESATKRQSNNSSTDWTVQEVVVHDSPSAKHLFNRHNSMPESPVADLSKPSTSGKVFGRYNSMPLKDTEKNIGDSPIRCTPEEIRKKHRQAREKLLAKRQLPFTGSHSQASQLTQSIPATQQFASKKTAFQASVASSKDPVMPNQKAIFQPRVASSKISTVPSKMIPTKPSTQQESKDTIDLKSMIEKKRQQAIMKLRRRQNQKQS